MNVYFLFVLASRDDITINALCKVSIFQCSTINAFVGIRNLLCNYIKESSLIPLLVFGPLKVFVFVIAVA